MATGDAIAIGSIMLVFLTAAWVIDRREDIEVSTGSQQVDLPPERKEELIRDVRNALIGIVIICIPLLIHFAVRPLPEPVLFGLPTGGLLVITAWFLWKYAKR